MINKEIQEILVQDNGYKISLKIGCNTLNAN